MIGPILVYCYCIYGVTIISKIVYDEYYSNDLF